MREKLQKLIQNLLFLDEDAREQLLNGVQYFSEEQLVQMYETFRGYEDREVGFLSYLFEQYPELRNQFDDLIHDVQQRAQVDEQITAGLTQMNSFPSL